MDVNNCTQCGKEFISEFRSDKIYCSVECGKAAWRKKQQEIDRKSYGLKVCQYCQEPFETLFFKSNRTKFCSKECKSNHHKAVKRTKNAEKALVNPLPPRECKQCQTIFTPTNRGNIDQQVYCSELCKKEFHSQKAKDKCAEIRDKTVRICPICEKQFTPKRTLREIYCSRKCCYAINKRVYSMMANCYNKCGTEKSHHSHEVLGYSPDDLLKRLQSFPSWQILKNESWHLDHIFPIIAFVRKGITDPRIICELENLQPLAGTENCSKNDIYDEAAFEEWLAKRSNV
jgi:hypothetical protein